jgi:hypothetical protein
MACTMGRSDSATRTAFLPGSDGCVGVIDAERVATCDGIEIRP